MYGPHIKNKRCKEAGGSWNRKLPQYLREEAFLAFPLWGRLPSYGNRAGRFCQGVGNQRSKDANSYFVNANSTTAPGIVDADRQPIIDTSEVYSGVYGRASINFYAFNSNGNKGIACGLNNLQKIRDGEPLGGKSRAEDDFADDEDDFLS